MENFKQIRGRDKNTGRLQNLSDLQEALRNAERYSEIYFLDHNDRPYVIKSLTGRAESTSDGLDNTISGEDLTVDFSNIKNSFIQLNDDQRDIVMHIYFMYKNNIKTIVYDNNGEVCDEYNPKIILHGPAGSGKTTIINFIEKLITWEESKESQKDPEQKIKVLKCAFTGKAAFNIDGFTLNHIFSIPFYNTRSLNKKRLTEKMDYFKKCIFFICDEVSMVGVKLMTSVDMRLKQIFESDKLYGDRFVLLVGDLYQIDPVMQKPVYPKSELWTCCDFYELTKIIRQQDKRFVKALNNFRDSQMTDEDIQLLKSREIQNIDLVPDNAIHLFYLNKRVDELNEKKLNKINNPQEIVNAIEDWLPSNLRVMIGIRYMITYNMDFGDGLVNGTTGVVKGFDYDKNNVVDTIWMEFHSNAIGAKTRSNYFKQHSKPGFENWVPIQRSKVIVKHKDNPQTTKHVANMFPLRAAEAITVHKSQGQTYHDGVCVHITDDPRDKMRTDKTLQYVALTRVTRLENLYICGSLNISITSNKFNRTEQILNQMRAEKKLKPAYETFEDKRGDVIIYLNTGSTFNEHHEFVTSDKWYRNASLLIFTQTNTDSSNNIPIANFEIAFRSDRETPMRSGGGMICYKKSNISLEVIISYFDDENKCNLTLFMFEKYLYILTGVKGDMKDDKFKAAIKHLISKYIKEKRCICLIGDIDIDSKAPASSSDCFTELELTEKLVCGARAPYDIVLTRNFDIPKDQIGFYEYIPSSHKPIFVKLPSHSANSNNSIQEKMEIINLH